MITVFIIVTRNIRNLTWFNRGLVKQEYRKLFWYKEQNARGIFVYLLYDGPEVSNCTARDSNKFTARNYKTLCEPRK